MPLDADLERRLLTAIEGNSLVFLCGAGLSVPSPSFLPGAPALARICYDRWKNVEDLDPALSTDLDRLAGHFYDRGDFDVFVQRVVPWNELLGSPNRGHATVADFLICRAALAALSANFDNLIEHWAQERKVDLRGALDGQQAEEFASRTSPILKFHGCLQHDRDRTLWTQAQLTEPVIQHRISTCSQWMQLNLPNKDILVVASGRTGGTLTT